MTFPKHFSLKKEHDKSYEIHDVRDNKSFHVAKKDIHPANQLKILKMQKLSEGGVVDKVKSWLGDNTQSDATKEGNKKNQVLTNPASAPVMYPTSSKSSKIAGYADGGEIDDEVPVEEAPVEGASSPLLAMPAEAPQVIPGMEAQPAPAWHAPMLAPEQAPQGSVAPTSSENQIAVPQATAPQSQYTTPGFDSMAKGMESMAAAQGMAAREQQQALLASQKREAEAQQVYDGKLKDLDSEQQTLQRDVAGQKIDSRKLFHEMGTPARIGTALSMILGGIGAGLTGGPNMALKVMDKAVDDDITAQKANLGKSESLLHTNLMKYGNLHAAEAATRLHYNTILQTQLQAAQAKATNGIAAATLQTKIGQLKTQDEMYKRQLAFQGAQAASLGAGGGEGGIPVGHEPPMLMLDPKYRETRVEANGRAYTATGKTEAEQMRRIQAIAEPVVGQIQELRALSTDPMTKFAGSAANNKAHGIIGRISVMLPQLSGLTRINEVEIHNLLNGLSDPTRMDQAFGDKKNLDAIRGIEEDIESKRQQNLVGYKGMNSIRSFAPAGGKLPLNR